MDSPLLAFYRAELASDGNYSPLPGLQPSTPVVGRTHGWMRATVSTGDSTAATDRTAGRVQVRFCEKRWVSRLGSRLADDLTDETGDENPDSRLVTDVDPSCVRAGLEPPVPDLSLLVVRWASKDAEACTGFSGGWGASASPVSDRHIEIVLGGIHGSLGCTYEVVTAWVCGTTDIQRLGIMAATVTGQLRGRHTAAMWFLWPVDVNDGLSEDYHPGTAHQNAVLESMRAFEGAGVPARYPHSPALYRVFLSKEWTAQLCAVPGNPYRIPATTCISLGAIAADATNAAKCALRALVDIEAGMPTNIMPVQQHQQRGVIKAGFSWEARGVRAFDGVQELALRLDGMASAARGSMPALFVQRRLENVLCEIRSYIVDGKLAHTSYTRFLPPGSDGAFCNFERSPQRERVLCSWLDGGPTGTCSARRAAAEVALTKAEMVIQQEMIPLWARWLKTVSAEDIPAWRLDVFVLRKPGTGIEWRQGESQNRNDDGSPTCADDGAAIDGYMQIDTGVPLEVELMTGELTETGFSMLHWDDGLATVLPSVLRGCFKPSAGQATCKMAAVGDGGRRCVCCTDVGGVASNEWKIRAARSVKDALAIAATLKRGPSEKAGEDGGDVRDRKHARFDDPDDSSCDDE